MEKRIIKRYSEAFKRQVVSEYADGQSIPTLQQKYNIRGSETIPAWIKKYAHSSLRHELVTIQRPDEREREKALEKRLHEMEAAIAQLMLEKIVLESSLAEAEKLLGMNVKKTAHRHPPDLLQTPFEGRAWA